MKAGSRTFWPILAVVVATGLIFSLYAAAKIRSIRALRVSIAQAAAANDQMHQRSQAGPPRPSVAVSGAAWSLEFIELAYGRAQKLDIRDLTVEQRALTAARRAGTQPRGGRQTISSTPVKMSFHATYRQTAEFVRALQDLGRPVTVDHVAIRRDDRTLAVDLTASTYARGEN